MYRRQAMRRCSGSLLVVVIVFFTFSIRNANAQLDHISISAGSDEDKALQAITT